MKSHDVKKFVDFNLSRSLVDPWAIIVIIAFYGYFFRHWYNGHVSTERAGLATLLGAIVGSMNYLLSHDRPAISYFRSDRGDLIRWSVTLAVDALILYLLNADVLVFISMFLFLVVAGLRDCNDSRFRSRLVIVAITCISIYLFRMTELSTVLLSIFCIIGLLSLMLRQDLRFSSTLEARLREAEEKISEYQGEIAQYERISSLGMLGAGMAHELNTPIGSSLQASMAMSIKAKKINESMIIGIKKSELDNFIFAVSEGTSIIDLNLRRCADLVKSFKSISQNIASDKIMIPVRLAAVIDEVLTSSGPLIPGAIAIQVNAYDATVLGDPMQLSQVFSNLIMNAVKHGFNEGTMPGEIKISAVREKTKIVIACQDNGRGIDPKYIGKIFDPFFTTKPGLGGGTGLGLSIVYDVITKMDGNIKVTSEPGNTTFTITLQAGDQ